MPLGERRLSAAPATSMKRKIATRSTTTMKAVFLFKKNNLEVNRNLSKLESPSTDCQTNQTIVSNVALVDVV